MSSARGGCKAGETLSAIAADFARRLGIAARIVPMSDDPVRTRLDTSEGWLELQHYFVRRRCEPAVRAVEYAGAAAARPQRDMLAALGDPDLRAVVICPSNPLISIGPILALPGLRAGARSPAPRPSSRSRRSSPAAPSRDRPRR